MSAIAAYDWIARACRQWLIDRARPAPPTASDDRLDEPPWADVERLAHVHSVEPLLHVLARRGFPPVSAAPLNLTEKWEQAYYSTRIRNAESMALLEAIMQDASAASLPLLVLKGAAVMAAVYGDLGLRPMADLDLLCRTSDLPALATIARSLGFKAGTPYLHQLDFHRSRDEKILELHFDLHHGVARTAGFLARAWSSSRTAALEDWRFPVMSDEHQLVFELAHCAHHDFDLPLKNSVDFSGRLMLQESTLDWRLLMELLRETGLTGAFEAFRVDPFERPRSFGLVRRRRTAGHFVRQRGLAQKAVFLRRRLFPPLAALQAAHGLRSRSGACAHVPLYAGQAVVELAFKLKAGF